jgi:hypothetical protein
MTGERRSLVTLRFSAPRRDIACGTARREGRRPSAFVDSTTYTGISFSLAEAVVLGRRPVSRDASSTQSDSI